MTDWGLSAEARAFLADPVNLDAREPDPAMFPQWRAESLAEAESAAPGIVAQTSVTLGEEVIAGVRCLTVTPGSLTGEAPILYLFGGAYIMGGPLEDLPLSAKLAAKTGRRVIAPHYRLAPENPFPAGLDDCAAVAAALADAGPFAIAGESAGGNLALASTGRLAKAGARMPLALALMSPGADMHNRGDVWDDDRDPTLSGKFAAVVPTLYAGDRDKQNPEISPVYSAFTPDWPPTLITTGTRDRLMSMCARLSRAMRAGGAPADLRLWDGMWHVFEFYPGIPEAEASLTEIADFLTKAMEDVA
ncbi:MAG: alpha/beta hydrolase fold domain-containing protein [Pseudomonadota bacterium]